MPNLGQRYEIGAYFGLFYEPPLAELAALRSGFAGAHTFAAQGGSVRCLRAAPSTSLGRPPLRALPIFAPAQNFPGMIRQKPDLSHKAIKG